MKKIFLIIGSLSIIILIGIMIMKKSPNKVDQELSKADVFSDTLLEAFDRKRKELPLDYKPRTRHLDSSGWAKYTNRLFLETSPYLLQHAHNPVNWYPWGDEAFDTAKKQNLPVLLSVGYSTCHWCHVMEEESFEDEEIARFMNENYIVIKVDREERPDVDAIYMTAVQTMTGHGGWPMTVWLTPERKPFFGGTYFPARDGDRGAGTGFLTLLKRLKTVYENDQEKVKDQAHQLAQAIASYLSPEGTGDALLTAKVLHSAISTYKNQFDENEGGMNYAPKFPSSMPIRLLLRYYRRTQDKKVLEMAQLTLNKMAQGGMYDHVGGGFHRYSTDKFWLVPHFEKMLYDNALLTLAYLEAYQVTNDPFYQKIVGEILRYVERDMTSAEGAFYSATDADSPTPSGHREEGYFFTWPEQELEKILSSEQLKIFKHFFVIKKEGDFEGRNILHTKTSVSEVAKALKLSSQKVEKVLDESKELLYQQRHKRPPPIRDEKILTSWNGLMISAHAQAGLILNDSRYIKRAVKATQFILDNLYVEGRLYRSFKDGKAKHNGYLDDYAFFSAALLDLYEATQDIGFLKKAIDLDKTLQEFYEDQKRGGFFMTSSDHEKLLAREKPSYDGAEPSGNSIALLNLYRLSEFTTNDGYRKRADLALKAFSQSMSQNPTAFSQTLQALDFRLDKPKEIIIVTPKGKKDEAESLLSQLRNTFLPNKILVVTEEGEDLKKRADIIPYVQSKYSMQKKSTAYVCEKGICELPTHDPNIFLKQISVFAPLNETSQK